MDLQKEREAFEAFFYENCMFQWEQDLSEMFFQVLENNEYDYARVQSSWLSWQAAKAQAASEVINIGNELQSWVAVHSFADKDGSDIVCAVDANALAEEIEKLTGGNA